VILEIEVQGCRQVKKMMPEAVSIFIAPPNFDELERRLRGRGTESEDKIRERLATAKKELEAAAIYDYTVVNDQVDDAVKELRSIMDV
jgi:guanylate kinase